MMSNLNIHIYECDKNNIKYDKSIQLPINTRLIKTENFRNFIEKNIGRKIDDDHEFYFTVKIPPTRKLIDDVYENIRNSKVSPAMLGVHVPEWEYVVICKKLDLC
jgi:hypothetical protein